MVEPSSNNAASTLPRIIRLVLLCWFAWVCIAQSWAMTERFEWSTIVLVQWIKITPLLLFTPTLIRLKKPLSLIMASIVVLLYAGNATLNMFGTHHALWLHGVELLLLLALVSCLFWYTKKMPAWHQQAH